jgi:hypothetical protein
MPQGEPEVNPSRVGGPSPGNRDAPSDPSQRSKFLREALVLQFKLILEGLKDVLLGPVSLVAVAVDLLSGRSDERRLFYRVLRTGQRFERFLNLYGALPEHAEAQSPDRPEPTVDAVLGWGEGRVRKLIAERREGCPDRTPVAPANEGSSAGAALGQSREGDPADKP